MDFTLILLNVFDPSPNNVYYDRNTMHGDFIFITQQLTAAKGMKTTVRVFPNPTVGSIVYSTPEFGNFEFVITDVSGRELDKGDLSGVNNTLNLSKYKAGVYFITIVSENYRQTDRIILEQ